MNALLWKDLYSTHGTLIAMLTIATVFSWGFGQGGPLSFFVGSAMASSVVGTCMNLDEKAGWHRFAISSGIKRRDILHSKCVIAFIAPLTGLVSGVLALIIGMVVYGTDPVVSECVIIALFGLCFGIFTSFAMIYSCYRFSSNYAGLFAAVIIGAAVGIVVSIGGLVSTIIIDAVWLFAIIEIVLLALSGLFYMMSRRIIEKKDF